MPPFITDGLRACQIDAVSKLEGSMAQNHPRALVYMATGAQDPADEPASALLARLAAKAPAMPTRRGRAKSRREAF